MDAQEKTAFETNEQEEELRNILSEGPLDLDMSLVEREDFVRYLVSIVLR